MNFFFLQNYNFYSYFNLQITFFIQQKNSIQILEAVLYKQQGRSDKPRPCKLLIMHCAL